MATAMESAIAVLVIIAILVSAGTLYYMSDLTARIAAIEEKLPPTLTVLGPWAGKEMDAFLPVLQRFEGLTGYKVVYKTYRAEDLATLLPTQFEAGKAPGDVIFMWGWFIKEKGAEGHALNVTGLIDETDFSTGALDPVKANDTLYGGAYTGKVKPGFWYRKSFFTANGLTEPTTWAEFEALLADIGAIVPTGVPIASGDTDGWPLTDVTEHFIITYGGPDLHKALTNGTVAWTSSQVKTTVFENKLVPLLTAGYFSEPIPWTTAIDYWWRGDYGLYFMGSWITGMVENATDLGVFSLPGTEGYVFGADYFFIPTYTNHPEEAKELFKFLAGDEGQRIQVAQGGHIATNVNVALTAYPAIDKMVANITTGKELLVDLDDTIGGEFQSTFWSQLRDLWVHPDHLNAVLAAIEAKAP